MQKKMLKTAVMGVVLGTVAGFLFNPEKGKKNRDKVKKVSKSVVKRVREEVDALSEVTKPHYNAIIEKVIADFKGDRALSKEAWDDVAVELKERWADISREVKASVKKKKKTTAKKKAPAKRKTTAQKRITKKN